MSYWQLPLPSRFLNAKASFLSWEGVPATAKKWDSAKIASKSRWPDKKLTLVA